MAVITTSLVVQFGDEETAAGGYHLSAEVDARPDGMNKGNTRFQPGDSVWFLIYASPELTLTFTTTSGVIVPSSQSDASTATIQMDEWITFANSKEQTLSKPIDPSSTPSITTVAVAGIPGDLTRNGMTLSYPEPATAVVKALYQTKAYLYQLTNVPTSLGGYTSFPVVVVVTGTAA